MRKFGLVILVVFGALVSSLRSEACTSFLLESNETAVMGKSYDWVTNHGMAYINKRNVEKTALLLDIKKAPMSWVSQHGSVTFSQFAQDFPVGGMNESGLMVEILWLNGSEYPTEIELGQLNELQWIQYILDTASDVGEAVDRSAEVQVLPTYADVHYLVCDVNRACATFEYLDGYLVIHDGELLTSKTLTNTVYSNAVASLPRYTGFGGSERIPSGSGSTNRFVRTAYNIKMARERGDIVSVEKGFEVLDDVKNSGSVWQLVYQPDELKLHYKVRGLSGTQSIDMNDFDFSCSEPVLVRDMLGNIIDQTTTFVSNDYEVNLKHITVGNRTLGSPLPRIMLPLIARYPETTHCLD